jgi:hypothetical protein
MTARVQIARSGVVTYPDSGHLAAKNIASGSLSLRNGSFARSDNSSRSGDIAILVAETFVELSR